MTPSIKTLGSALLLASVIYSCGDSGTDNATENSDTTALQQTAPAADTVNMPALVVAQPDGSLLMTAENGKAIGPDIKYMPEWRAFGWFTAKDSVEWDVDVPAAGDYTVTLEWSVSDEEAGKEFILTAGDQQLTGKVDKSGSWETFKTADVGKIKLKQGQQKLVFKSKTKFDKGAILDFRNIKLTKA